MSAEAAVFYVFATITVGAAAVVVLARSLIYSAFALLFTFFGVAGLYVLLGADFLAATQLLIYVGGILVLLLFGVMLTHKLYDLDLRSEVTQFGAGIIMAAGLFALRRRQPPGPALRGVRDRDRRGRGGGGAGHRPHPLPAAPDLQPRRGGHPPWVAW